jgi:hypothetical protein
MAIPGLMGALTSPTAQQGMKSAGNAVKGALSSLPGPVGGAYKTVFNTQTSISNTMSNNMGRIAQGAQKLTGPLGGMLAAPSAPASPMAKTLRASRGFTK